MPYFFIKKQVILLIRKKKGNLLFPGQKTPRILIPSLRRRGNGVVKYL
jgi:hypothetical protein